MLFRQGPLPGPKLIMEYHRGEISDEDLEKAWADAVQGAQALEKTSINASIPAVCVCDAELLATDFSFTLPGFAVTFKNIVKDVIDLGACRVNRLESGGGEIMCLSCETLKGASAYDHKMWHSMWKQRSFT